MTILGNLIDNALDAVADGALDSGPECSPDAVAGGDRVPRVTVTVRADRHELLLRVADSGPGIDPDTGEEVFRRGWPTKRLTGPADRGLGLALVRQAVRRHGGTVELDRATSGGAEFTVRLPLRAAEVTA